MDKREATSRVIEGLLRYLAGGSFITAAILIPGLAIGLDKPFNKLMDYLDEKDRQRELRRIVNYMHREQLVTQYEHGIEITEKGHKRLARSDFDDIHIKVPMRWDGKWRVVVFDIPEEHKSARNALAAKLSKLGFQPLQRSVWVHPFPCHEEIEAVALYYKITDFVTYLETHYIDKPDILRSRFSKILKMASA